MSLRRKTSSAIVVTMASLIVILYGLARFILLDSFGRLEETDIQEHTQRALAALSDDVAQLAGTVGDWAPWDDTYAFVENLNEDYIKANLIDSTFTTLRLNLMLFVNASGQPVFSQGFDARAGQQIPVAPDVIRPILANASLVHYTDPDGTASGIVTLPDGPMLIASHPILTSAHNGPIRGALIFGRYLNSAEVDRLAGLTHLSISLEPPDAPDAPAVRAALSNTTAIVVRPVDEQTVAGYALLMDVGGRPAMILKVSVPRLIYAQGQNSVSYFVLALVAVGLVFSVGASWFLDRLILRRLGQLSASINRIRTSGDLAARVPSAGQDEVACLGRVMNEMLIGLQHSAATLRESEQRFHQLFATSPDAILLIDPHDSSVSWPIVDCNETACQMNGYTREELIGQSIDILNTAPGTRDERIAYRDRLRCEGVIHMETFHRHKDGHIFPIELSTSLFTFEGHELVLGIDRDITERKLVEEELRHHREHLQELVAARTAELSRVNEELQQEIIERQRIAAAEREQWEFAEALRDTAAALNSSLYVDEVLDRILDNVGRVTPYDATNIMLVEDGVFRVARERGYAARGVQDQMLAMKVSLSDFAILRRVRDTQQPVAVADTQADPDSCATLPTDWARSYAAAPIRIEGQVIGFLNLDSATVGFFTSAHAERLQAFADQAALAIHNAQLHSQIQHYADELELRVAERTRQLTAANQKLQELDRMKDQFVSNVSHELRTPITSIMLQTELLQHGKPAKRDAYLGTLRRESDRLRKMIEDLLDLSRLDRGATPMQPAPTDPNQLLGQLVADRAALATARGLSLEFAPTPDLPPVMVDVSMLTQVTSNLVTNALNYTPSGGHVTVTTAKQRREDQDWVTFSVRDTGPGISAKDLPHLFERFYRGEVGRKASAPGTGLGLAICQEILTKHGGQIMVESEPGQGAAFTVWLKPA